MGSQRMHKLEVLLIGGYWPELMLTTLGLLTRAGFTVDVISTNAFFKKNRSIRDYFLAEKNDLFVKIASEKIKKEYTLVVIADDPTLEKILNSNLSNEEKLALLPVLSDKHFAHIFSKIGLSQAFKRSGLLTPDFRIANDEHELKNAVRELDHPVVIKLDSSSGGAGVFESSDDDEFGNLITSIKTYPVLVQKKIKGVEVSIEAFYQHGRLIHFACSIPEKYKYKFGPTSVRRYVQLSRLDEKVFEDLRLLGRALGANGFVNISSIRSDVDQKLYFFEADMRPNLWINHSCYFGDDPAKMINSYFSTQEILKSPYPVIPDYPEQILLSHPFRISLGDLILNHHQVWRHLPENFLCLMLRYRFWAWVTDTMAKRYKRLLPKPYRALVKKHLSSIKYSFSSGPG